ncbi:MAG: hypothetical protein OXI86_21850 [Candidatus Poribacteria bacterium]|nr:hypothetical protein [Candidatus Poribacteria bacterium]
MSRYLEAVIQLARRGKDGAVVSGAATDVGYGVATTSESLDEDFILTVARLLYWLGAVGRFQGFEYGSAFGLAQYVGHGKYYVIEVLGFTRISVILGEMKL